MGKKELSGRANWEKSAGVKATTAEQNLYSVFEQAFQGTKYKLYRQPKHLKNLYASVVIPDNVKNVIYNPLIKLEDTKLGVSPDFAIENCETHKILFGEIKRQDGWVEGKDPSAGRGNAHERSCKLFAPGLIKAYRHVSKIDSEEILPFWVVFQGDITRDPKRVREIMFWYDTYQDNYFMWRPSESGQVLLDHFNNKLKKYLD